MRFEAGGERRIWPQALSPDKLLYFIMHLLQDAERSAMFRDPEDQLELGKRLVHVLRQSPTEASMTPLLVRLYVDEAVQGIREGKGLDEFPASIPEVYFRYLERLNPEAAGAANRLTHEQMLRVSEALAQLSLEADFVPRELCRSDARAKLEDLGFKEPTEHDPLERLKDNGVLLERPVAGDPLLRFQLDPIAEVLAARSWARECGSDESQWRALVERVRDAGPRAEGFLTALRLVCAAYGAEYGWGCAEALADEQASPLP